MYTALSRRWLDNAFPANTPVVLLHPNFANQHLLLEKILDEKARNPIFLTLQRPCNSVECLWQLLSTAVHDQLDSSLPALDAKANIDKSVQAFLKAAPSRFTLVIDAFDLAQGGALRWVAGLANALPSKAQIVLGTRDLPLEFLNTSSLQGKVAIYPTDQERMLVDYANQPPDRALLEVYCLGPGHALINGRRIDRWDGILPRSLFFYFIDKGMVTRDEIFQTFWPTLSVREATNVFHVTKRKISEILGFDLTIYWSGFYRISPEVDLHYDVIKFVENVQNSVVANDDEASTLLERAVYLYRGLFLGTLDMNWANSRRSELQGVYADALSSLGKLRQRAGDMPEALGLFLRAASTQPHREDLARGIMSLYVDLGQSNKALEAYERLTGELKTSLGVGPDRQTVELAETIRKRK